MDGSDSRIEALGRAYAAALLAGDEIAAELAVRDALDAKLSSAEIDDQIIAPALWLIGELWQRGELTIADEHLATEISTRVIALEREVERVSAARAGHRVLLAAPAGELHVMALRMNATLLREAGYGVTMLGADVPIDTLAGSVLRHEPDVICLTATMPGGGDQVLIAIHEVLSVAPAAAFVVGGRDVVPRLRPRPGIAVCQRVSEVVESVDAMVQRADMN